MTIRRAAITIGVGVVAGWVLALVGIYVVLIFGDDTGGSAA